MERPAGNVDIEQELLTAVYIGWGCDEVAYAMTKLTKHDFLMPEHAQLFIEYRAAFEQGVPIETPALLKEWLRRSGGLKRLAAKGMHEDEQEAYRWVIAMYFDRAGLPYRIPYYCHVLRKYRLERATKYVLSLEDSDAMQEATAQLALIDRLTDWKGCG